MAENENMINIIQALETEMRGSINQVMTSIVQEVNEKFNKILESTIQNAKLLEVSLTQHTSRLLQSLTSNKGSEKIQGQEGKLKADNSKTSYNLPLKIWQIRNINTDIKIQ